MPKKPKAGEQAPPASSLTHSPFAALRGAIAPSTDVAPPKAHAEAAPAVTSPAPTAPPTPAPAPRADKKAKSLGRVVLRRETKHRGGKAVIIVTGLSAVPGLDHDGVEALAQKLKKQLGCGGTVEARDGDRQIVLQGDRAAQVAGLLRGLGYRVDGVTQ